MNEQPSGDNAWYMCKYIRSYPVGTAVVITPEYAQRLFREGYVRVTRSVYDMALDNIVRAPKPTTIESYFATFSGE